MNVSGKQAILLATTALILVGQPALARGGGFGAGFGGGFGDSHGFGGMGVHGFSGGFSSHGNFDGAKVEEGGEGEHSSANHPNADSLNRKAIEAQEQLQ